MNISDVERLLHQTGQNYVEIRKECLTQCANLFDTHEITLAEKNCEHNCFKKLTYAKEHFHNLASEQLAKVNGLRDNIFTKGI